MTKLPTLSRRRVGALALGAGLSATVGLPAFAVSTKDAEAFVTTMIAELRALVQAGRGDAAGAASFLSLLEARASIDAVGKFAVGRAWRDMSAAQQGAYKTAFRNYISRTYQRRFREYAGEDIVVTGSTDAGAKGVLVASSLVRSGGKPLVVEWLVDDRSGKTLLSDIVFEGVSLAITLRETFGGMIEKRGGDLDQFISDLAASEGA